MDASLAAVILITALGCGLNAGVFFAFSSFVLKALASLPPAQGISAMQALNIAAVTPVFMTALFGTALGCLGVAVWALLDWHASSGPYLLVGSGLYLLGSIGLTIAYHVPRNDRLGAVPPHSSEAAKRWSVYLIEWTPWNHVRAAAGLAAAVSLTLGLVNG